MHCDMCALLPTTYLVGLNYIYNWVTVDLTPMVSKDISIALYFLELSTR